MTDVVSWIGWLLGLIGWAAIWGGIGGMIGGRLKNRATDGFIWGALLGPVGVLIALAMASNFAECPECLAPVPREARRCRHCGSLLKPSPPAPPSAAPAKSLSDTDIDDWLSGRK